MDKLNIWLKKETASLLLKARVKFVNQNPNTKPIYDQIIREALRVYINAK